MEHKHCTPDTKYGIRVIHNNGINGWIADKNCKVMLFKTKTEAAKALNQMKLDPHYLWKYDAEVTEFIK